MMEDLEEGGIGSVWTNTQEVQLGFTKIPARAGEFTLVGHRGIHHGHEWWMFAVFDVLGADAVKHIVVEAGWATSGLCVDGVRFPNKDRVALMDVFELERGGTPIARVTGTSPSEVQTGDVSAAAYANRLVALTPPYFVSDRFAGDRA